MPDDLVKRASEAKVDRIKAFEVKLKEARGLEVPLAAAREHIKSPEELREQRISFVYGQLMDCAPHVTREQVAKIVDDMDQETNQ